MTVRRTCFLAMLVLTLVAGAYAQDFRATLTGVVTDSTGAAIPNATVKAVNTATNEIKETKTTADGVYTIPYLNPGTYNIEVSASGFQTLKREAIVLRVADKVNLPVQLTVGAVSQEITVTGQQDVIETASADRGLVFDPVKVQEYPLNGRQTYMLLSLTPGVIFTTETFGPSGNSGTRGWDTTNAYRINGARTGQNLFLLNGAPISDNSGTWELAPNVEAVQEFKVMTNTYDAGFGRFGGGVVNTTLKSGTNAWHGDVFEYWRNKVFDANYFQNNTTGAPVPKHNQHQWGGVLGGPIRKDKDFVFGSLEGWRERIGVPALNNVPPVVLRDGQGFTAPGYKIYDPMTTHLCNSATEPCQGSTYIRNQFANNSIPAARTSAVGKKIIGYYPAPNLSGLNNNYVASGNTARYRYEQPMARWDHVFGEKDRFYTLFMYQHGKEYRETYAFGPPAGSGDMNSNRTTQDYTASWTHVLSPTAVLDVRGAFARYTPYFPRYSDFSMTTDKLGMTQMPHAPSFTLNTVPMITVGGYDSLFALSGAGNVFTWSTYNQWNFTPSLMLTRGRHTLRSGFEVNYVANGAASIGWSNGTFAFGQGWTQQFPDRSLGTLDGAGAASLLLGTPTSGSVDWNDTTYRTRPYYGFYAQDDWKVSSRLTLNLGLRYDVQLNWLERYNRAVRGLDVSAKSPLSDQALAAWAKAKATYDAANPTARYPYPAPPSTLTSGFLFPGVGGQPRRLYGADWTNLAPRIGVAWQVRGKTVVRAGGGVYYMSPTRGGTIYGFNQQTPYTTSLDGLTPSAGLTGPYSLENPFPNGLAAAPHASLGLLTNVGNSISFDPPRYKTPRTYQYSFGIQRELPLHIMAEVSYAGNHQSYIESSFNQNYIRLADYNRGTADNSFLNRTLPNPFYGVYPITSSLGSSATTTALNLLRPSPVFTDVTNNLVQQGHYRSDALQVKIEKRVLGGGNTGVMTWVLSYTFAKAFQQSNRLNNWNDAEPLIYEIDNQDKPQNLAFSGVWDLPLGKNRKFLNVSNPAGRTLASDWRFNWIFTYLSGYPVSWPNLINSCSTWKATNQDQYHWFNNDKSCYKTLPSYTPRTLPDRFSDIRNPSAPQLNVALEKTIPFKERYKVQLRWEAFNLFNTPIRPGPDTSFTSASFGQLPRNQNNWPRVMQLAAKIHF